MPYWYTHRPEYVILDSTPFKKKEEGQHFFFIDPSSEEE